MKATHKPKELPHHTRTYCNEHCIPVTLNAQCSLYITKKIGNLDLDLKVYLMLIIYCLEIVGKDNVEHKCFV